MQTRDGRPARTGPEAMPGPADSYVAYGKAWATQNEVLPWLWKPPCGQAAARP